MIIRRRSLRESQKIVAVLDCLVLFLAACFFWAILFWLGGVQG